MYPNLYYFFKDVFGISLPVFKLINAFGFFMALSFISAAWLLKKELRRKQQTGYFTPDQKKITVGEKPTFYGVLPAFLWGCIVGYKLFGLLFTPAAFNTPLTYLSSPEGSVPLGISGGFVFAALRWFEIKRHALPQLQQKNITVWPAQRVTTMALIAAVTGLLGAKLFDNIENWHAFIQHPLASIFSATGFAFYGGLIAATLALWYYARKRKFAFIHLCDAAAPALMFAYAVGRMGCQVAGDGDWGVINTAYLSFQDGKIGYSDPGTLDTAIAMYGNIYIDEQQKGIPQKQVKAFAGLPDWLFACSYLHNINKAGVHAKRCTFDDYCNYLPIPVFPTPLYEIMMAIVLFTVLWALRKKIKIPGRLFALYLVLAGIERLVIEPLRVHITYHLFGLHISQAEIISVLLVAAGAALYLYAPHIKTGSSRVSN
ncbi:MAG TPA: prolipoprotein diacylglyceryl transferase family protein [Chitinophagaceae bacterium]|nr:prolipoprotein diacylglyceryl transferase family protein [Chitinophagaceae bacterium]